MLRLLLILSALLTIGWSWRKSTTTMAPQQFTFDTGPPSKKPWNFKISSWSIFGLRAMVKKGGYSYLPKEDADVYCLQDIRCQLKNWPQLLNTTGYNVFLQDGKYRTHHGIALLSKTNPLNVDYNLGFEDTQFIGLSLTAEYEKFYLLNVAVPTAGMNCRRMGARIKFDNELMEYVKDLEAQKPVIIAGNMNVAHNEIDTRRQEPENAGQTDQERIRFGDLLATGYVDVFRHLYPNEIGAYTYWSPFIPNDRKYEIGARLDYFLVSKKLMPYVVDTVIRKDVQGSDHCPITLFLNF